MAEHLPSPELAGKYEVIGIVPGPVESIACGRIDLRTISLATADKLHATGRFPYLRAIPPEPTGAPATAAVATPKPATPRKRTRKASV
jgi:hypothetical protein